MAIEDIEIVGNIYPSEEGYIVLLDGIAEIPITNETDPNAPKFLEDQQKRPTPFFEIPGSWAFRGYYLRCNPNAERFLGRERVLVLIKHRVMQAEQRWQKIEREVEAFDNLDRIQEARRSPIPRGVRLFVWQRDEGKCVECGSQNNLEYDHLIPVARGGASTERNIRLLCEMCNRRKGADI